MKDYCLWKNEGILSQGLFMPSTLLSHAFGAVVRCKRQELGLSQEDLAERAQVHPTYIGLVERCKRNCSLDVADNISRALGSSLSALLKAAEQKQTGRSGGRKA